MRPTLLLATLCLSAADGPVFDIPRIPAPQIDGDASAWQTAATTAPIAGAGSLHLAWCEAGLAVAMMVDDPEALEDARNPWAGDSVELFLAPLPADGIDFCQWTATPGRVCPAVVRFADRRVDVLNETTPAVATIASHATSGGYTVEALLPWSAIRLEPRPGAICRLQVLVNDLDAGGGKLVRRGWHPLGPAFDTPAAFQHVRLAERAQAVPGSASWSRREDGRVDVAIRAERPEAPVRLRRGDTVLLQGVGAAEGVLADPAGDTPVLAEVGDACIAAIAPHPAKIPYWEGAIRRYEAADRLHPPAPGGIVFYGSSTMGLWKTLAEDFPGLPVIGRGFGGSSAVDALRYLDRVVVPYRPSTVVIYSGGNGIAGSTPADIGATIGKTVDGIHAALPETRVVLLSMKPTIKMLPRREQMIELNRHYQALAEGRPWLTFVDCWTPFLDATGAPDRSLLCDDLLHPSRQGYIRLASLIAPHLPARP